ncbi:MAG: hypothetical protein IKJ29_09275 [Akkermansia sp.]|nr:hypothetical protein [Akkermansia sp.]
MMVQFYKMTGAESDFVMVDNRDFSLSPVLTTENIADVCNRRYGIGAEGLIAIEPARDGGDVRVLCYAADGSESPVSTDAALCSTAFADFLLESGMAGLQLETPAGLLKGTVNADDSVSVQLAPSDAPVSGSALIVFRGEVIICED